MLGQAGLRQVVRSERIDLKAFCRVDDRRAFASIVLDYAIILATAVTASWIHHALLNLLAIVIIAGRQSALQGLVHSACHFSLFSRQSATRLSSFFLPTRSSIRFRFIAGNTSSIIGVLNCRRPIASTTCSKAFNYRGAAGGLERG